MEIVVFGAGSLGSLIGGLLAGTHAVTLVGRDPHMAAVRDAGLRIEGLREFTVHPTATTDGTGLEADLAVVTVKSFDTDDAGRALATGNLGGVLSLQNGMGNEDRLAEHVDAPVLAGTTTYGAIRRDPGVVEWTGEGTVTVGGWRPAGTSMAATAGEALRTAGIETEVVDDVRPRLWEKLAVNAAINPVTALARVENGALRREPAIRFARTVAREAADVAHAEGIELSATAVGDRIESVAASTAPNRSSMYQDVATGRRTEIEAINGFLEARADDHGVAVPVTRTLAALVRTWEAGRGLRES